MRLLAVESHPRVARNMQTLLPLTTGAEVDVVDSIEAGIDALVAHDYDAVAFDVTLSATQSMSGLRRILDAAKEVPVVVVTPTSEESIIHAALSVGAEDFFVYDVGHLPELGLRMQQAHARRHDGNRLEAGHHVRERDALVRHFLNEASHELRTPLTSIGAARQALRHGDMNAATRQRLARNLDRLQQSIEDFLGVLPHPSIETVPVHDVLEAARGTASVYIPDTEVSIIGERQALERALRLSFRIASASAREVHVEVERSSADRLHIRIVFEADTHPHEEHPILTDVIRRMTAETMGFFTAKLRGNEATLDFSLPALPSAKAPSRPHPLYTS